MKAELFSGAQCKSESSAEHVREDAVQTAAMALRLAMDLEQYTYQPCKQMGPDG